MFVTCLLLYYRRDSFTKLPCSKLLLFIHGSVVRIGLLWPVRQLWFSFYCHAVILSASQFDDHDCEMYGHCIMSFACYCHDGIVSIELLWPVRQLWLACYCHGVILERSKLSVWWSWLWNEMTIELLWPVRQLWFACDGVIISASCLVNGHDFRNIWPVRRVTLLLLLFVWYWNGLDMTNPDF